MFPYLKLDCSESRFVVVVVAISSVCFVKFYFAHFHISSVLVCRAFLIVVVVVVSVYNLNVFERVINMQYS